MLYLAGAVAVYIHSICSVRPSPPQDVREGLSVLLLCTALAALWPLVLVWTLLVGTTEE